MDFTTTEDQQALVGLATQILSEQATPKRLAELEDKIARAQVIDISKLSGKQVKFGATVNLVDEDSGDKSKYKIVGEDESDVKGGKISITSPIARALIGKEEGDVIEVMAPGGPKFGAGICVCTAALVGLIKIVGMRLFGNGSAITVPAGRSRREAGL